MSLFTNVLHAAGFILGVFFIALGLGHWIIVVRASKKDLLGPGAMLMAMGAWMVWG